MEARNHRGAYRVIVVVAPQTVGSVPSNRGRGTTDCQKCTERLPVRFRKAAVRIKNNSAKLASAKGRLALFRLQVKDVETSPLFLQYSCFLHGLLQVGDDVFGVLEADAEAEEAFVVDGGIMRQLVAGLVVVDD